MSTSTYKQFEDPDSGVLPDKMTVYQECMQAFNASPIQAKKCRTLLARLLRLCYHGDSFPRTESTNLFFSVSKLFHNSDPSLRQLAYLAIKELCSFSDDILMITASIMKDIQAGAPIFKPNAVRTLARVLDGSTIHTAERAMRNCIVDQDQAVCVAALACTYHLLPVARDVVRRWANEAQDSISASKQLIRSPYAAYEGFSISGSLPASTYFHQYLALGLLYQLKNHDRIALLKLIQQLTARGALQNSFAVVQLVRFVSVMIAANAQLTQQFWPLLSSWLRNKSEMVELEAAKAILTDNSSFSADQQAEAIAALQGLLSVARNVTRFAAIRLLSRVALTNPELVRGCNGDIEELVNDPCRSVATYAITTLLKTGSVQSVDRLVKTISGMMGDISEEFKTVVVDAIRTLALKFPDKHASLLGFLGDALRDEGGFTFKNSVVDAIFDIVKFVPDARPKALALLCEFIEDCEYTDLAVRVLHLLGEYGPKTATPSVYVRHIYNRVVLENSIVRSSAVIALSKFALVKDQALSSSIAVLLRRCLDDPDDEVRDRAALSLRLLEGANPGAAKKSADKTVSHSAGVAATLIDPQTRFSLAALEQQLCQYVRSKDSSVFSEPFDLKAVPTHSLEEARKDEYERKISSEAQIGEEQHAASPAAESKTVATTPAAVTDATAQSAAGPSASAKPAAVSSAEVTAAFPDYGKPLHSCQPVALTEQETEFVVSAVKHVFKEHLVVEYKVSNTLKTMQLEDVRIVAQIDTDAYEEEKSVSASILHPDSTVSVFTSYSRSSGDHTPAELENTLSYVTKELDETTGEPIEGDEGFPDEYQVENLSISASDFVSPSFTGSFATAFGGMANEESAVYQLGSSEDVKPQDVVNRLIRSLSMMPLEGSDKVTSPTSHTLKLFGESVDGAKVGAIVRIVSSSRGAMMKVQVRSSDAELSQQLAEQWGE